MRVFLTAAETLPGVRSLVTCVFTEGQTGSHPPAQSRDIKVVFGASCRKQEVVEFSYITTRWRAHGSRAEGIQVSLQYYCSTTVVL